MRINNHNNNISRITAKPSVSQGVAASGAVPALNWEALLGAYLSEKDVGSVETSKTYRKALTQYFRWIDTTKRDLREMTTADILAFKKYLGDVRHCTSLTVSTYVVAIRGFYEWAEMPENAALGLPNIAKGVHTDHDNEHIKMHLTHTQTRRLLDYFEAAGLRDYAMVNLMLRCGLRTVEVHRADVRDIAFIEDQRILYIQGKGKKDKKRWVVLRDSAYEPLKRYLDSRDDAMPAAPLFVGEGKGSRGRRLSTRTIQDICKRGLRAIGLDSHQYSAHSLRHTAGVSIIKNGGTVADVQEVLGHASIDTSRIYLKSASTEIRLANPAERYLDNI